MTEEEHAKRIIVRALRRDARLNENGRGNVWKRRISIIADQVEDGGIELVIKRHGQEYYPGRLIG